MANPRLSLISAVFAVLPSFASAGEIQSNLAGSWTLVEGVKELGGKGTPIADIEHGRVFLVVKPDGSFFQTDALRHSFLDVLRNKGDRYVTSQASLEVAKSTYEPDRSELILVHDSGHRFSFDAQLLANDRVKYRSAVPSYGGAELIVTATLQRVDGERPWEPDDDLIASWTVADGTPFAVDVSADGKLVVAADLVGRMVYLWDVQQGGELRTFAGHVNQVSAVAISPDGRYVASGSRVTQDGTRDDHSLKIWDATTGAKLQEIDAFSTVTSLEFLPDGKSLLAAGIPSGRTDASSAGIWNVETGKRQSDFATLCDVKSAIFLPDSGTVVCVCSGRRNERPIGLYDKVTGNEIKRIGLKNPPIDIVTVSPDGSRMITCSQEPFIREWEIETGQVVRSIEVDEIWAADVAYLPDGSGFITANESDNTLHAWDLASGQRRERLVGHRDHIRDMQVSADGRTIVSCSDDGTVKVWRVPR